MINIDPIRAAVAPYALLIKLGLVVLLCAAMFIGGCNHGEAKLDAEVAAHKATKDEHKRVIGDLAALTKAAADKAKAASVIAQGERKANDKRFEDARHEAAKARSDLARALRAGTVQLRPEFACPAARPAESRTAAATGRQDADADLRRAREGAILDAIADADEADRWIGWLQDEVTSTRKACNL